MELGLAYSIGDSSIMNSGGLARRDFLVVWHCWALRQARTHFTTNKFKTWWA